jgi:hypothetical protein
MEMPEHGGNHGKCGKMWFITTTFGKGNNKVLVV